MPRAASFPRQCSSTFLERLPDDRIKHGNCPELSLHQSLCPLAALTSSQVSSPRSLTSLRLLLLLTRLVPPTHLQTKMVSASNSPMLMFRPRIKAYLPGVAAQISHSRAPTPLRPLRSSSTTGPCKRPRSLDVAALFSPDLSSAAKATTRSLPRRIGVL